MFEELQLALLDLVTPERLFVILEAHRVLMDLGIDDVNDELQQVIGLQDGISDTNTFISRIEDTLLLALSDVVSSYAIELIDEVNLIQLTAIVRTAVDFDNYIIPDTLVTILSTDHSNEEKFASIVPLFTELSEEETLEIIIQVSDATIKRMSYIATELLETKVSQHIEVPDQLLRVKRINSMINQTQGKHPLVTFDLANSGVAIGQNYEMLVSMSIDQLERLPPDALAYELVGMAYFSKTPISGLLQAVRESIYDLLDEPKEQQRLNTLVNTVYREFSGIDEVVL